MAACAFISLRTGAVSTASAWSALRNLSASSISRKSQQAAALGAAVHLRPATSTRSIGPAHFGQCNCSFSSHASMADSLSGGAGACGCKCARMARPPAGCIVT